MGVDDGGGDDVGGRTFISKNVILMDETGDLSSFVDASFREHVILLQVNFKFRFQYPLFLHKNVCPFHP